MPMPALLLDLPANSNVVPLRLRLLPRHREYLMRWLEAGTSMGLCDVDVSPRGPAGSPIVLEQISIWVRENADPAYVIRPDGMRWLVIDHLRDHALGSFASLEEALYCIRPVLTRAAIVAA